jgi:hypothetical protein
VIISYFSYCYYTVAVVEYLDKFYEVLTIVNNVKLLNSVVLRSKLNLLTKKEVDLVEDFCLNNNINLQKEFSI